MPYGGESGIRTHDRVAPIHAFQACAFNHSATSPARCAKARIYTERVRRRKRFCTRRADLAGMPLARPFFRGAKASGSQIFTPPGASSCQTDGDVLPSGSARHFGCHGSVTKSVKSCLPEPPNRAPRGCWAHTCAGQCHGVKLSVKGTTCQDENRPRGSP